MFARRWDWDYKGLKRRTHLSEEPSCSTVGGEGLFVELASAARHEGMSCVVELEKGNGAKLRVSVGDQSLSGGLKWHLYCHFRPVFSEYSLRLLKMAFLPISAGRVL